MRTKHVLSGLAVVVLLGGFHSRARGPSFSRGGLSTASLRRVQDRGTLRVGLGLFEPWSACNTDGELIGFEVDVATKIAEDIGVGDRICADELELHHPDTARRGV